MYPRVGVFCLFGWLFYCSCCCCLWGGAPGGVCFCRWLFVCLSSPSLLSELLYRKGWCSNHSAFSSPSCAAGSTASFLLVIKHEWQTFLAPVVSHHYLTPAAKEISSFHSGSWHRSLLPPVEPRKQGKGGDISCPASSGPSSSWVDLKMWLHFLKLSPTPSPASADLVHWSL